MAATVLHISMYINKHAGVISHRKHEMISEQSKSIVINSVMLHICFQTHHTTYVVELMCLTMSNFNHHLVTAVCRSAFSHFSLYFLLIVVDCALFFKSFFYSNIRQLLLPELKTYIKGCRLCSPIYFNSLC